MRRSIFAALAVALGTLSVAVAEDLGTMMRDDRQWVMPAKDYANTRYSSLGQINAGNAGQLRVAWTFSVGSNHGQEAAPIVIGDTMYVVGAYPNEVFALNATTGDLKWKYSPHVDPSSQGVACCDVVTAARPMTNGKIFFKYAGRSHRRLDAATGRNCG